VDVKEEAFLCPFCGAPYRELIPAGVVQVKCKYCQATVLVPPRLGGLIQRCPNHPEVLAVGLCNDCGKSYCDRCLYIHKVEGGELHVCPKCYENRHSWKVTGAIIVFILFFCIFFLPSVFLFATAGGSFLFILFLVFSLLIFLDITKKPLTIHDARLKIKTANMSETTKPQTITDLYEKMLHTYVRVEGSRGKFLLEKKIGEYVKRGLSQEEAILKAAKDEGYVT